MKKAIVIILAIAMVLSTTPIAFADTTVIKGDGRLLARGVGSVSIEASGTVDLTGAGYVEINDPNGTANIRFRGKVRRTWRDGNTIYYQGFRGRIFIQGDNLKVHFIGRANSLLAAGTGKVIFDGRWLLRTRGRRMPVPNGAEIPINEQ